MGGSFQAVRFVASRRLSGLALLTINPGVLALMQIETAPHGYGAVVYSSGCRWMPACAGMTGGNQSASNTPAAPMPVPMHMVTMPYFCLRRRMPWSRVAMRTAPVAPRVA